ncbi:MAG: metallophosphoesterase [Candidatus Thiosymbion ectosymbiont of Robbea hypermnestra]|nr:metallophosphoesterase [Candidatus Thiosymbion ectosymbiont of Robbea hypermnestra]
MRNWIFTALLLAAFAVDAQERLRVYKPFGDAEPRTGTQVDDDPGKFHFVVVTDRTGGERPGIWSRGLEKINLMQPALVVSVGDLIQGYTKNQSAIDAEWTAFDDMVARLEMPFFYVAGNHDFANEVMGRVWRRRYGADYYAFTYKKVLFLCLNSEDGYTAMQAPDLGRDQVEFVRGILAAHPTVRWTMVFMHQPLWLRDSGKNWLEVERLLRDRPHSVFTGHRHGYRLYRRHRRDYFVLATMGGASKLRGKSYGEFDHFLWVTMTRKGPVYANLLLGGVEDKHIRLADNPDINSPAPEENRGTPRQPPAHPTASRRAENAK